MKISLKESFKEGWKQTKSNYKFIIPLFFAVIIISLVFSIKSGEVFSVSGIVSLLVSPVIYYVVTRSSLRISRNEKIGFGDLFKGLSQKTYLSFLAVTLLTSLVPMILISLGTFVGFTISPFAGMLFSLVSFIFVILYFIGVMFFAQYRLIDVGSDFWNSIKDSFELGKGNRALLFKFLILAFLLNMAGAMLVGIGLLITIPITSLTLANIYDKLKIKS